VTRLHALLACVLLAACSSSNANPDAASCLCDAPNFDAEVAPDGAVDATIADAGPPDGPRPVDLFDHFTLVVTPTGPTQGIDFTVDAQAYSSSDDSVPLDYAGTVHLTASFGTLSGSTTVVVAGGAASFTVQNDTAGNGCLLTVTDTTYPAMTGQTSADIAIQGAIASLRDVVINELNWFGNADSSDEWIELRNTTASPINVSSWTLVNAGDTATPDIVLRLGTVIDAGGYLVVGRLQGPDVDTMRTSLTGVAGVEIYTKVTLTNGGEELTLRDVGGNTIDQTPAGAWPAGDNTAKRSMERTDESGGGYSDGSQATAWHTWRAAAGSDTTSADTSDHGTPGAANTPPPESLYATSFETSDPAFELTSTGTFQNDPLANTAARTGTKVIATTTLTTSYGGRHMQSVDCIALLDDTDPVAAAGWAVAGTANGGNVLSGRVIILWYSDACTTPAGTPSTTGSGVVLPTSYTAVAAGATPPAGATHAKIAFEVHDNNGAPNDGDAWAGDDFSILQ